MRETKCGYGTIPSRSGKDTVSEKHIERVFATKVKKADGMALKFISPSMNGVPDRILLFPGGKMAFAELKAPGKMMRPLQLRRKKQLEKLGFRVYLIDGIDQIEGVIDEIRSS